MEEYLYFLLAVGSAFCATIVCGAFLTPLREHSGIAVALAVAANVASVLWIPPPQFILRAVAALIVTELSFKLIDCYRYQRFSFRSIPFRRFLLFLVPFPPLQVLYNSFNQWLPSRPPLWLQLGKILVSTILILGGFALLKILKAAPLLQSSFLIDHLVKLALFMITIESISMLFFSMERLLGYDTMPLLRSPFFSQTVGEFWSRYNTRVHGWLMRNVAMPLGGGRAPIRAIAGTFLVSGLFHELMFSIALSRFTGYQMAFFLLQIPAVLLSPFWDRLTRSYGTPARVTAHTFTIAWLATTSIFFFHGVSLIFPNFYAGASCLP